MTHELKQQIATFRKAKQENSAAVMATLVDLDGSSYRRPGVRMLILENGTMIGAVSGGCVEKEIIKQSLSVFATGVPKMMTYDGRYRLGCDGVLYILIEPFNPSVAFFEAFDAQISKRENIEIESFYKREAGAYTACGSTIKLGKSTFSFQSETTEKPSDTALLSFTSSLKPCFRLLIIGAEHDAVQLCTQASILGWEVVVVTSVSNPQTIRDFPGAHQFIQAEPEMLDLPWINEQTAVVLMTHSYARDLKYLLALKEAHPLYIGLLGPARRRDKLLNEFTEHVPMVEEVFFEFIYGPAGLDLGSETPEEIALSICSEILTVQRRKHVGSLKDKTGSIHSEQ